jgi:glyoxylase-like metal-dependent hydrolase (beta-lactamase superfamily II)
MIARPSLLATCLLASPALAQAPAPTPAATPGHHDRQPADPFTLKPLRGGVHALYGRGGNVGFLVGPEAVLVVDSQYKDMAPGIVEQIRKITDKPIKFLVNTHHHGDHVGGNETFRPLSVIIAHDNVRRRMLASPQDILRDYPARLEAARAAGREDQAKSLAEQIEWARKVKVEEIPAPILTYDSELRIHVNGETIQVWHTPPAHTDGDSSVYFEKANVLHMGDLFFHRYIPFIDVRSGGSPGGYLKALDAVLARVPPDVTIIPGHGEVTDVAGLKQFRQYITDIMDAARKARTAGQSKEDFVKSTDLATYSEYRGYPDRFRDNLAAAYDESGR